MAGQCFFRTFKMIKQDPIPALPTLDLPDNTTNECCADLALKVLAHATETDEYKNDVTSVVYWFDPVVNDVDLELWKLNAAGAYAKVDDLNDSSYGEFTAYGDFVNTDGEKFIGYQIDWREVLIAHGAGSYKVKWIASTSYGTSGNGFNIIGTDVTLIYCLSAFTAERANRTVRLEYYINSIMGDAFDPKRKKNFVGLDWYNSFRLPGYFNFSKPKHTEEYNEYFDRSRKFIKSEREDEYVLKLKQLPGFIEKILRNDFNQADQRFITDYNNNTPESIVKMEVNPAQGKYEVKYYEFKKTFCELVAGYNPTYNNNKKLRS